MTNIHRRSVLLGSVAGAALAATSVRSVADTTSLSDIGASIVSSPEVTIFQAREIVTLDPSRPIAEAVAVVGGRILATGSVDEVEAIVGDQPRRYDARFADKVIVPGFIAQHDHPVLAALTMSSEILSIEDWALPTGTVAAVKDRQDFVTRLTKAVADSGAPGEPLMSWGYHPAFYGALTRADLDAISTERPILVWARSCHEMILNSAALKAGGVTQEVVDAFDDTSRAQSNLEEGRFWEQGFFAVMPNIASLAASPERLRAGLELSRDYMHSKGITFGNEPGGILAKPVQDAVNAVFSSPDMPFRWSFIVDAKSLVVRYPDDAEVIARSEELASWYGGMTSLAPKQAKLFSDGAIYSQLMQVREPYLDAHHGEWMMDRELFERAFRVYWDAGYQLHVHVNGDAGLDRVLDTLELNLRRNPRYDHRTVIVHFAVSAFDQVERIRALGAIVSGNPYYVAALADQYSEVGLGPERADAMVRLGDLSRAGIRWSLHSDMPMAPADPLFLMWCAVTRQTSSGRVAAPDQTVTVEEALRGVTIEAAYSLKMEDEIGSIVPGKRANLTILDKSPMSAEPEELLDIGVWGTVIEGRVLEAGKAQQDASLAPRSISDPGSKTSEFEFAALEHVLRIVHVHR
ncbi:amidohydrolase [Salipiger mangrovisoli]|uniref:Amidohydrolase n=1 Tax=Salipiger mangrovisoli TaxID=2865933 RepID=A0ABR9XAS5_9RHOB|nr:amidohydrolase [Salipiger mangrovisoli]MBE9640556.1 amidohydrolase [Salipiger mangrovisoli]